MRKKLVLFLSIILTFAAVFAVSVIPSSAAEDGGTPYWFYESLVYPGDSFEERVTFTSNGYSFDGITVIPGANDQILLYYVNTATGDLAAVYVWGASDATGWNDDSFRQIKITDSSASSSSFSSFLASNAEKVSDLTPSGYYGVDSSYFISKTSRTSFPINFTCNGTSFVSIEWFYYPGQTSQLYYYSSSGSSVLVGSMIDGVFSWASSSYQTVYFNGLYTFPPEGLSYFEDIFYPVTELVGSFKFNDVLSATDENNQSVNFSFDTFFKSYTTIPYSGISLTVESSGVKLVYDYRGTQYSDVVAYDYGLWNGSNNLITFYEGSYVPTSFYNWLINNSVPYSYTLVDPDADTEEPDPDPDPEEYVFVSGSFTFNDVITIPSEPFEYAAVFSSAGSSFNAFSLSDNFLLYVNVNSGDIGQVYIWDASSQDVGWTDSSFKAVVFDEQRIEQSLYNWLTANGSFSSDSDSPGGGSSGSDSDNTYEPLVSWELVTDISQLQVGDSIIIVAYERPYALSITQSTNNRPGVFCSDFLLHGIWDDDIQIITLSSGSLEGTYAFNVGNGYLRSASASSNTLKTSTTLDASSSWNITIVDGVASIVANGEGYRNVLQFNNSSNLFACYESNSQTDLIIYKRFVSLDHIYDEGYSEGFDDGYSKGYLAGFTSGKDTGYTEGYATGYSDGSNAQLSADFGFGLLSNLFTAPVSILNSIVLNETVDSSGNTHTITLWSIMSTILITLIAFAVIRLMIK